MSGADPTAAPALGEDEALSGAVQRWLERAHPRLLARADDGDEGAMGRVLAHVDRLERAWAGCRDALWPLIDRERRRAADLEAALRRIVRVYEGASPISLVRREDGEMAEGIYGIAKAALAAPAERGAGEVSGSFREARGVVKPHPDAEPPEDIIRRFRDQQDVEL